MAKADQATDLTRSTARILNAADEPVGTGILVSARHIVTCAHVVNEALGRDKYERTEPASETRLKLDFPLAEIGESTPLTAQLVHWWYEKDEDVAGLILIDTPPVQLAPIPLKSIQGRRGQAVEAFSFPLHYDDGQWVDGIISGRTGKRRLQIKADDPDFEFIRRGFSGGPVWLVDQSGVIGITVESDEENTAYCIPADALTVLWPDLSLWSKPPCPV